MCPAAGASKSQQTVVLHASAAGLVFMSLEGPRAHWGNAGRVLNAAICQSVTCFVFVSETHLGNQQTITEKF